MSSDVKEIKMVKPGAVKTGKRILFANVPADGHFNPLTGLAKHLQSSGYDVRWYTSASYVEKLKKLDIPSYTFNEALDVNATNVDDFFPERLDIKNKVGRLNFDLVNFFILRSAEYYADILEILKSFPFDLMIADCMFTAIPFVKEKMNIPVISIGVLPLFETSVDLAPAGLGITPSTGFAGRIRQSLLRYISDKILFKKSNGAFRYILNRHRIPNKKINFTDLLVKKSSLLLQIGTPGFEYHRSDLGKNIRFIGPLLPYSSNKQKTRWFDERFYLYRRIVLVTQGTVEKDINKIMVPTLEAFKNSNTLVIAATGGSQTRELKKRYPYENIIIEDFIPFSDVMPYADVYITNGGYGGVMLGIKNKLPMVVAGVHEGKNEINARIGYFGLGVNLKTETPTAAQIKAAVNEVLNNSSYRINVEKLEEEFSQYNTYHLCESYVNELLQPGTARIKTAIRQMVG